ncbi:MAG: TonB-dependent receptor, partial [Blastocatellia bacterium]|nr:TonB-dependent receptor [Blastocatellia bacterium]
MMMFTVAVFGQHIRGALEGTVVDQTGAVINGAKVTLQNQALRSEVVTTTNNRGAFNFQNLEAGDYTITIEQTGFRKFVTKDVTVKVGSVTPLNISLEVGTADQVVEVTSTTTEATVDTSRSTVDGVVTAKTIDNLPLNGRNFLDLAQLEPGVQVRDGGDFDPTKNQMSGVSIGGRSGRSTRIQVDGVDITDETVGTTTTNISNESIQEFQLSRSTLDASTDLTSSGAVNIVTRSGSNDIHGGGFTFFRNQNLAADLRLGPPAGSDKPKFDREIGGGNAGGYFIKDKWFWHVEYEQNNQDGQQFTSVPAFPNFTSTFAVPLDERLGGARTDYNLTQNVKLFYRFGYNYNAGVTGFGGINLSAFANKNFTNTHVAGLDYATSRWTHSVRFSYLNFNNSIVDANSLAGTPATLDPAGNPILVRISGSLQDVGPNLLAPQQTFQDNKQSKYDASLSRNNHTFRFGAGYNRIDEAVFADFFGLAPRITAARNPTTIAFANMNGGSGDPLNYPLSSIVLGNGLGAFSEKPALGFPNGGTINNRLGLYFTDSWKVKRNFTLNFGVRYDYDSGLADADLKRTATLAAFNPTLAGNINNDNNNIAPQAGFAWDIRGSGKFVVRGGTGIYYDTNIINNFLFDRVLNLPPGLGNDTPSLSNGTPILTDPGTGACLFNVNNYSSAPGQCDAPGGVNLIGQPLKNVISAAQNMQKVLQGVSAQLAANYPPPGVAPLFDQVLDTEGSVIYNGYKRPYSFMANIGL